MLNALVALGSWIVVILAIEEVSEVITASDAFAWFRGPISRWAYPPKSDSGEIKIGPWYWRFLAKITTCGWCMSGWVSLVGCWFLPGSYFYMTPLDNIALKWFAVWKAANIIHDCWRRIQRGLVHVTDLEIKWPNTLAVRFESTEPNAVPPDQPGEVANG